MKKGTGSINAGSTWNDRIISYIRKIETYNFSRGRNAGHPAPPAQILACVTNAPGSYLGY